MKQSFLLMLLIFYFNLQAQINPGPRITALGMTGVALQDAWSMQSNPAGIAAQKTLTVATAYEREFLNPELCRQSAVIIYPDKNNVFGLSFQNYGFSVYNEQRAGFAYARNFGNTVFAALDFNYHQINIQQYGSATTYSVELGLQYLVTDKLLIGAHITNPNGSRYDQIDAVLPVSIEFGGSYRINSNLLLNSGILKIMNSDIDVRTGLEYSLPGWLDLRGGVSIKPFMQYAGFGCNYRNFHFDAAVSSHSVLGYSPQIALKYEF